MPEDPRPRVALQNLNHYFGSGDNRKQGLINNNLTLMPGEMVVMTGPSGSGKTTLLTLIGAIRTVQEGSAQVLGQELLGMNGQAMTALRQQIGFIFQAHNLFDALTAFQNVRLVLELFRYSARTMDQMTTDILGKVGLADRIHYKPQALSGGQRQRVAIARALVNQPQLILADEPTAALDKASGREVVNILKDMTQRAGCTVLMVTHDSRIIDVADRIVNMIDGRIASEFQVEEATTIIKFLVKCPVFSQDTPATLAEISQKMVREHYAPGSAIIRQGEEGDKFYVLREGAVEVKREEGGATTLVANLGVGDFFGEAALLTGEPRNATVVALDRVVVYSLKKSDFLVALNACGSFKAQLRDVFFQRQ